MHRMHLEEAKMHRLSDNLVSFDYQYSDKEHLQKALYGAFLKLAKQMRAQLNSSAAKLTIIAEIDTVKCLCAIPLTNVPILPGEPSDLKHVKEQLNNFKKVKIKERRTKFV